MGRVRVRVMVTSRWHVLDLDPRRVERVLAESRVRATPGRRRPGTRRSVPVARSEPPSLGDADTVTDLSAFPLTSQPARGSTRPGRARTRAVGGLQRVSRSTDPTRRSTEVGRQCPTRRPDRRLRLDTESNGGLKRRRGQGWIWNQASLGGGTRRGGTAPSRAHTGPTRPGPGPAREDSAAAAH